MCKDQFLRQNAFSDSLMETAAEVEKMAGRYQCQNTNNIRAKTRG